MPIVQGVNERDLFRQLALVQIAEQAYRLNGDIRADGRAS